ncbi:MAG: STAS-like domain-containing protein [Elusimicrobiota bacterium]
MRKKSDKIKQFILDNVSAHPKDISLFSAKKLKINRRTAIDYLHELSKSGEVSVQGKTRARVYILGTRVHKNWDIVIGPRTHEDEVWREKIFPTLSGVDENVRQICQHGFTEMLNNAIDHSEADHAEIRIQRQQGLIRMTIRDNGIGIFERLRRAFGFSPEEALLELQKGKLTTNPEKHSGEGIFFTSKMFDTFHIQSRGYGLIGGSELNATPDPGLEDDPWEKGTEVVMLIHENSLRKAEDVFGEFSNTEDFGFVRTRIPMIEAKGADEELLSRSQAKRVMMRTELFKEVILDFRGVARIGQAFADEIFRVFKSGHPDITISVENASEEILKMISWVGRNSTEAR